MDGVLCVTPAELAESTGPVTFHPEPRSFALEELGTLQGFERVVTLDLTRWGVDDAEAKVLAKKVRAQLASCSARRSARIVSRALSPSTRRTRSSEYPRRSIASTSRGIDIGVGMSLGGVMAPS